MTKNKALASQRVLRFRNAPRIPGALVERFMSRLEPIRLIPERMLEIGSAAGDLRFALRKQYPQAEIISMERDFAFCSESRTSPWRRLFRPESVVCAVPHAIPLPSASVDMVCANLVWVRAEELAATLHECARVLRAQGLLMLVGFGPQTLSELREVWSGLDQWEHTHRFADMHDIGDALVHARLSDVVVDSERLLVEFDDLAHLLREVRDIGGGNRAQLRRPGLASPKVHRALSSAYPDAGGYVQASVELVFAHAWMIARPGMPIPGPEVRRPD